MIDANKQRSWLLTSAKAFGVSAGHFGLVWDARTKVLRLRSAREGLHLPQDRATAAVLADQPPMTLDAFGTWAGVNPAGNGIEAGGVMDDVVDLLTLPAGQTVADMAMNSDGVLYAIGRTAAGQSTVYLINRLESKETAEGEEDTFAGARTLQTGAVGQPDRVAPLGAQGALLLDRARGLFFQVVGEPCRDQPPVGYLPRTPRPCEDFPPPQRLMPRPDLVLPENRTAIAMASNPDGEVAVLLFPEAPESPAELVLIRGNAMSAAVPLADAGAPFSIGWAGQGQWALMFDSVDQAIVYAPPFMEAAPDTPLTPVGQRYPLNRGADAGFANRPFFNSLAVPARYPSITRQGKFHPRPLHALSYPAYPLSAETAIATPTDSGQPGTIWHRLYLEAHLPPETGVRVWLAAADDPGEPDEDAWCEHQFGALPAKPGVPAGAWLKETSEVPFHKGLLSCRPEKNRAGLFTVLIQKPGYTVRSLKGRYLHIKLSLEGNGRESPRVAALRVYGPRFSYLNAYLPELYKETSTAKQAQTPGTATGSDFLQRFLCLFESLLTPLEDKAAAAYMATNPMSAPAEALDWLSGWVALTLEPGLPEARKRDYIRQATALYRLRGTVKGLALALDLATDKWAAKGDIVLLEDFRLRRTFATILGADLSVENDPLLMGKIPNANSYIGDTLILGEESRREFLALYAGDVEKRGSEQSVIDNFYARLANRITVLVHREADEEELALIRRVVSREIPAHINFRIVAASKPLLIGLYSLVGMDTYLRPEPPRRTARIGHSFLGRYDFVKKLPVLDERLEP